MSGAGKDYAPEPWIQDDQDPRVVNDRQGQIAALAVSPENALRIIASVNAVQNVSSKSLEEGIVSEGLQCLYLLCRYHCDEEYKSRLDREEGFQKILARGNTLWGPAGSPTFRGENWFEQFS